jgi:hypothetical protein
VDVQLKEDGGCCLSLSFTIHPVHLGNLKVLMRVNVIPFAPAKSSNA